MAIKTFRGSPSGDKLNKILVTCLLFNGVHSLENELIPKCISDSLKC